MNEFTTKTCVLGLVRAAGPVMFDEILDEVKGQVVPPVAHWDPQEEVVDAINQLAKDGLIELYGTGDAWV